MQHKVLQFSQSFPSKPKGLQGTKSFCFSMFSKKEKKDLAKPNFPRIFPLRKKGF